MHFVCDFFQHEHASVKMFEYLVEVNDLELEFQRYGLFSVDLTFIKEQIAGPSEHCGSVGISQKSTRSFILLTIWFLKRIQLRWISSVLTCFVTCCAVSMVSTLSWIRCIFGYDFWSLISIFVFVFHEFRFAGHTRVVQKKKDFFTRFVSGR